MLISTLLALSFQTAPIQDVAPGQLQIVDKTGAVTGFCPLERTSVQADIAGFGSYVTVTQTFNNSSKTPIEAVYTFPLTASAAVDSMKLVVGKREIIGMIKKREEARQIYENAKNNGQTAALLDQERPNIFTQSVANIMPGESVSVKLTYSEILKYEKGQFEFSFPMVVGPRFLGNAPDPGKIAPPTLSKGVRSGAGIDLKVNVHAGAKVNSIDSVLHEITTKKSGDSDFTVSLKKADEMPNKDFILHYSCATEQVQSAFIPHVTNNKGFFSLILMPPKMPTPDQIAPREVVMVMDQSGSQGGLPIAKSKELTLALINKLRPNDTFNVMGFNNTTRFLWQKPQSPTARNIQAAKEFVNGMDANGGTQLLEGAVASLKDQNDPNRLRIVLFNTDGFVGDEAAILGAIQKNRDRARMFTFGIGNGVNRFLIEAMSTEGRGASEVVTLASSVDENVNRFLDRMESPVLTDIKVSFDSNSVQAITPQQIPDVFSDHPIVLFGRYDHPGPVKMKISGKVGGRAWSDTIDVNLPDTGFAPSIRSLWARNQVEDLTRIQYMESFMGPSDVNLVDKITNLGLEYGIMTQYTSFVAVEEKVVNIGGKQRTVRVPVEMTDGVSMESDSSGGFGGGGSGGRPGTVATSVKPSAPVSKTKYANTRHSARNVDAKKEEAKSKPASKIDKSLTKAKGKVEIQIWLSELNDKVLKQLKELGFVQSDADKSLKIVYGSVDSKLLEKIAKLEFVESIKSLK